MKTGSETFKYVGHRHIHMSKKTRHIPSVDDADWDAFNEIRNEYKETWSDVFKRFHNYQDLTEHFFKLPKEVDNISKVSAVTVQYYLPWWLENMYRNFIKEHVKDLHDIKELANSVEDRTRGVVIGAGPSLWEYGHLEMLAESDFYKNKRGTILCTSHSLEACLTAGVVPDYMTVIDCEDVMIEHVDHDIIDEHCSEITGIFALHTHPDVLERWNGKKVFIMTSVPDVIIPNVQGVISGLFPGFSEFDAGAHVGAFTWNIAQYMGCKEIALIGLDCSFLPDTPVEETPYYEAYRPSYKTVQEMIDACYHFHTHSFFGNNCYTDDAHRSFAKTTVNMARIGKDQRGVKTINCTGGGFIDEPDVVENMHFTDWLKQFED